MKINYKKSDLNIINDKNLNLLTYEKEYLVPIDNVIMSNENIQLHFQERGKTLKYVDLLKLDKLRIIYELAEIVEKENDEITFELSPDNIYVDFAHKVRILQRKIILNEAGVKEEKLKQLKSLLGFLIFDKDYEHLINTNNKDLYKDKGYKDVINAKNINEFQSELKEVIKEEQKEFEKDKRVVNRAKYNNLKKNKMAYRIAVGLLLVFLVFQIFYIGMFKNKELEAYKAYIINDYTTVIDTLINEDINRLTKEDKYIFTVSTINTQSQLNTEQKDQLKSLIDIQVQEDILNYWVYIGQGNYEEANNMGIKVNDADMQIYALMLLIEEVQNDEGLEAEERQSTISTYEGQIESLKKAKEELNTQEESTN